MSFFAVLLALIVEQLRPLPQGNPVHESLMAWSRWAGRNFNAGREHHAWVVLIISVLGPALAVALVHGALYHYSVLLALLWDLVVLYFTLGFRQFSHFFTDIREALEQGREDKARQLLKAWRQLDTDELPRTELIRHVIEHAVIDSHRHVFGVFFWFVLGSSLGLGPFGAVLYRLSEFSARYWTHKRHHAIDSGGERMADLADQAFTWIDSLPARLTAAGFAIVGNFEDAVDHWRRYATLWDRLNDGVVLAAASGATGVSLGSAVPVSPGAEALGPREPAGDFNTHAAQGSTPGAPAALAHLQSVVGMVWRSVVLWMLILAALWLANILG